MSLNHPAKEQLLAFGQGKLADDESSSVEQHLEVCRECCETLLDLKDDTFVGLVKIAQSSDAVVDAASVRTNPGADASCVGHDDAHSATLLVQAGRAIGVDELPAELQEHPRYRIVKLIGRGGMGNVYRAEHRLMNRAVAIKLINSQLMQHPHAVERFRREVQAAAKLSHPNIVAAYDAEQAGNAHFLVMEFVEGTDLASVVKQRGPMSVAEASECIRQAAAGLQHAHEKGMVHRDIKPHNLMLSRGGSRELRDERREEDNDHRLHGSRLSSLDSRPLIRILDFGLAGFASESAFERSPVAPRQESHTSDVADLRDQPSTANPATTLDRLSCRGATGLLKATAAHLTTIGSVMGTPDYMAPEQAADAHSADIRADIYSLGCTLHFLLTGKPPFEAENVLAKLKAHANEPPPELTKLRKDVPAELSKVAARMMAKNPAERFQTPAAVADALAPFAAAASPPRRRIGRAIAAAFLFAALILAAVVIYVQTDTGEFEIHASDEVAVLIEQSKLKIRDKITGRDYQLTAGKHSIRKGEYVINVTELPDGVTVDTDKFSLTRGGEAKVTVSFKPNESPAAKTASGESPIASLRDFVQVTAYLNDPRNNRGGSVPVALLGREGRVAFRFGNWLVVFEGIVCDPKTTILGFSSFNIPHRGSSGEGTIDFGAGDKLPGVLIKFKFADEQNEISINNNRFKLRGKATQLEFGDKAYDATDSVQTIVVGRDGSTKLETPKNADVTPEAAKGVSQNLITDPSFENTGLTQLPRDWRAWTNEDSDFRCEVVNGGHNGQRSLRISGKGVRGVVFGNDIKADRTKRYALKGWAKFEGDKDARAIIKFNYFHGSDFLGVHDLVGVTADQPGWHLFEKTDALDMYPQADHIYAMCHVEGSGTGWFDDLELVAYDCDKLPADFDARHGRNNRLTGPNSLNRWVGAWETEYVFRETDNSPKETKLKMNTVSVRTLGDYFLMSHAKRVPQASRAASAPGPDTENVGGLTPPRSPGLDAEERLLFLTFDQNLGAFRQWFFSSNGKAFEWRGPWDDATQSLEVRLLPDASNLFSSEHFVDADHIEAKLRFQYVMGMKDAGHWTATRKAAIAKVDIPAAKSHAAEPVELSQLNKFAGEWTIRATYKPSVWNPQPRGEAIRETSVWILGGRFLMTRAFNEKDELTSIWIATYEPLEKSNHFWFFNADGSSGQWRLTWDEASRGFHFRAIDMPAGWIGTGFNRWIDDDTFDNQAIIKDENGRVMLDMTQDKRRKK